MKIEVYVIEFTYFDGVSWETKSVEITALSIYQLMKAYLNETRWLSASGNEREARKRIWELSKKYIQKTTLEFPIIKTL